MRIKLEKGHVIARYSNKIRKSTAYSNIHMEIKCAECGCVPNIDCANQTCNNCNKNVCCCLSLPPQARGTVERRAKGEEAVELSGFVKSSSSNKKEKGEIVG